jgi:predicted HTH transcriptional regulator
MKKIRVFVSSVQRELENERLAVLSLISTDAFLQAHCEAVLYEFEPASPEKAAQECLSLLAHCDVCLTIVWREYGSVRDGISITREEYRRARGKRLPILVFIKGEATLPREPGTADFLAEIAADGFKYKRFGNLLELLNEARSALVRILTERFAVGPTSDEDEIADQTLRAASEFEVQSLKRLRWEELDRDLARQIVATAESRPVDRLADETVLQAVLSRGLVWSDSAGEHYATAAGIVLLAPDPSAVFPQCRVLADAYRGTEPDGNPADHIDIRAPVPRAIEQAIAFVERNTRHPFRIIGLSRIRLDEYPTEALREALVNAVAHRDYEDRARKVMLEVFADKVVISSPGLPPAPLTLQKLRSGKYRPCSRNPVLAQCLSFFHRIEERGSGFRRMRERMSAHGLEPPQLATDSGYFQVLFPGPGENLDRIQAADEQAMPVVPPLVEQNLTPRQREMISMLLHGETLTSQKCVERFGITRETASQDFARLLEFRIVRRAGAGRSTSYLLTSQSSGIVR